MAIKKYLDDDGIKYLFSKIKGSSPTFYAASGGRVTYTVSIPKITALTDGLSVNIYFPNQTNTNCTLNVNSLGAKAIYLAVGGTRVSTHIPAASYVTLVYNAANGYWVWVRAYDSNTTYSAGTGLTLSGTQFSVNAANVSTMLNLLTTGSSDPTDNDYYISQYAGGGDSTTTYHRRPVLKLYNYMKGKMDLIYQPKGTYAGTAVATQSANGLMSATDKQRLDNMYSALNGTDNSKIDTIAEVYAFLQDYAQTTDLATQLATKVPSTRKVNNKALSSDITLSLDDVADGSTRKLANYLPKSGGTMTGLLKWSDNNALPSKSLQYILGIDAFAQGGATGWQSKSDFLSGYATQTWVSQQGYLTQHPAITIETDTTTAQTTLAHSGTFTVINGITRDSNGHITKINTITYKLPASGNTNYYPTRLYTTGLQISGYSGSTNCQLYVPLASASQAGVVSTGNQTFGGIKTFNEMIKINENAGDYTEVELSAEQNMFRIGITGDQGTTSKYFYLSCDNGQKSGELGLRLYKHKITLKVDNNAADILTFEFYSTRYNAYDLNSLLEYLYGWSTSSKGGTKTSHHLMLYKHSWYTNPNNWGNNYGVFGLSSIEYDHESTENNVCLHFAGFYKIYQKTSSAAATNAVDYFDTYWYCYWGSDVVEDL